jgi:hypothetical protein
MAEETILLKTSDAIRQLQSNIKGGGTSLRESPVELRDNSPTSSLDDDPFHFSSISYPRDITSDMANGHYMLFYVNVQNKTKYFMDPQEGLQLGQEITTLSGGGPVGSSNVVKTITYQTYADTEATYKRGLIQKGAKGAVLDSDGVDLRKQRKPRTGMDSYYPTTTRITDSVAIYLPPNVQDSTQAGYQDAATGVAGLAAAGGVAFVNAMRRNDFAAASETLVGSAKGLILEAAKRMGGELLEGLTGAQNVVGFVNKAFGQATNPYMEVLFDKMALRTFSYNFTFAPRNPEETQDVQTIIKLFRFHMVPETQGANERFLTLPSTFDIHYMYQLLPDEARENSFYSKIATCVLSDCVVDYTPGAVKSFASGAPTQITMNLTFKETEMITKEMVDKGF